LEALKEKEMRLAACREHAEDLRLMDSIKLNDSLSPEAREVRIESIFFKYNIILTVVSRT
jgi:hypothetical protein